MTTDLNFAAARDQMQAFKHAQLVRYAVAWMREAMKRPAEMFTCDIVPDWAQPKNGPGLAGSAAAMLVNAHVIDPVLVGSEMTGWTKLRRPSARPTRNGAAVTVYRLTSVGYSEAFLLANGAAVAPQAEQGQMALG